MISQTTLLADAFPTLVSVSFIAHLNVSKFSTASAVIVISLVVQPPVTPLGFVDVNCAQPTPRSALKKGLLYKYLLQPL